MTVDMNYIKNHFLTSANIHSWCENYAKENGAKAVFELVDHRTHTQITTDRLNLMLYNNGIPSYRNTYNLRSLTKEKAIFYLTVKGFSVVLVCHFIYQSNKVNGYKIEPSGQLCFDI